MSRRTLFADLFAWRRTFEGGLYLPDDKAPTARRRIEHFVPRDPLIVPLQHGRELPAQPIVTPGQSVRAGAPLSAARDAGSLATFAPLAGRITALTQIWTARDGLLPAAVLEPDDTPAAIEAAPPLDNAPLDALLEQAALYDIESRRPLRAALAAARQAGAEALLVNAMETEPGLTADLRLLVEASETILAALQRIAATGAFRRVILAVPLRHRRVSAHVRQLARRTPVEIAVLPDKYPQCHPNLLTLVVLRREVPAHASPSAVGAMVVPLSVIHAFAEFLVTGRPQTARVVTLAGDAIERPGNYRVPFGATVRSLLAFAGARHRPGLIIAGGPMTGVALPSVDTAITPDVSALNVRHARAYREPAPCIRCGWCVEDCPVGLDPTALTQLEAADAATTAQQAALSACIACGICSYVCPAQLPLTESIVHARQRLAADGHGGAA